MVSSTLGSLFPCTFYIPPLVGAERLHQDSRPTDPDGLAVGHTRAYIPTFRNFIPY